MNIYTLLFRWPGLDPIRKSRAWSRARPRLTSSHLHTECRKSPTNGGKLIITPSHPHQVLLAPRFPALKLLHVQRMAPLMASPPPPLPLLPIKTNLPGMTLLLASGRLAQPSRLQVTPWVTYSLPLKIALPPLTKRTQRHHRRRLCHLASSTPLRNLHPLLPSDPPGPPRRTLRRQPRSRR